jgi:hypothetical protein
MLTVSDCLKATKRHYPAGYGFALTFIEDDAGNHLAEIMEAANACVRYSFRAKTRERDSDVAAYAYAFLTRPDTRHGETGAPHPAVYWLIEAAQVLVQWGLDDKLPKALKTQIHNALRVAGHPGY